ncbi:hypothetical protein G4952_13805 [Blautia wexlerae]|uniref:Uncharacterized protein n=1 Tax=Blautia wexlerae TaxID=418240 RepID=A0ABX2GRF1_9FIRM|nr:hypothetical protein [Blautia wexlerae]NSF74854.1 hypothetical protein [Blautia wexlerae]
MAADGSIIIDTRIQTEGLSKGLNTIKAGMTRITARVSKMGETAKNSFQRQIATVDSLYQSYEKQERKVAELKSKLDELGKSKTETEEYKQISAQIKALETDFESVESKQREWLNMGFPVDSGPVKDLDKQLDEIWADMERLQNKQKEMQVSGSAYIDPKSTDAYKNALQKYNEESQKLERTNGRLYSSYNNLKKKVEEYQKKNNKLVLAMQNLQKAAARVGAVMKNIGSALKSAGAAVKSMVSAMKKAVESMLNFDKQTKRSKAGLGKMLGMSLMFSGVFRAINSAIEGMKEGFQNLAQYSNSTNASFSQLMSSMTRLKNSLATAFVPVLTVITPILTKLIDMCSQAATSVGMFFAALTGQTTFTQAKAVQQDYAQSLDSTSASSKKAATAANKQAKEQQKLAKATKKNIASFDELNVIGGNTTDTISDLSNVETPTLLPKDMFEDVPIKSKIKDFADRIKDMIKKQDWKGIGKLLGSQINKGLQKVNKAIRWDNVGKKIEKGVDAITGIFNSMVDEIDWTYLGNTIGEGLNTIVRTMNLLMEKTDFKNLGKSIAEAVNGLMDTTSWEEVGRFFGNRVMVLWDTLNGAIHELNWAGIGTSLAETLNGAFHRIDLAEIGDTLATSINGIFTSLQNFTATFDWTGFADNIKNGITTFLTETDWKANGAALGEFIEKLCETLTDVMTLENFQEFGKGIGEFLSELPWTEILKTAAAVMINAIGGLLSGLAGTPAGRFVDGLVVAFGSAKLIGILTKAFKALFTTAASDGVSGAITALKAGGVFLKFASAIGIGVAAGATASEKTTSSNDELKSTEQLLSNFQLVLEDLKEQGIVSGEAMQQLYEKVGAISSDTSPAGTISQLRDALVEAGVSSDQLASSIGNTDVNLSELYAVMANSTGAIDEATRKTKTFSQAIQDTEISSLIEKLDSLQTATDKVSFADLILKSANAIDEMGGIWENGKQILGEKAIAIHEEIVNKGLNPDKDGFYKLANGQMVQYGKGIEDSTGTLKEKTKSTLDAGLKTGIQEALPEQQQIGWDMGGYFITGYIRALLENKKLRDAYKDALASVDTTNAKSKAKSDGEELGKNAGEGFQKGIEEVSPDVNASVTDMMEKSVKEPAQTAVDAHSPSRWFEQLADWCGHGFGDKLNVAFSSTFAFFRDFRARISNSIGNLYNIGHNFLIGMNNGMMSAATVLYNNAQAIVNRINNIFRNIGKSHSTSSISGGIVRSIRSYRMPAMTAPQIPYLAKGTVVPRNAGEFAAILGDNKRETEVVSPLSTMKQAMMDALREYGNNSGSSPQYIVLNIDGNEFIRWLRDQNGQYRNRTGFGIFEG